MNQQPDKFFRDKLHGYGKPVSPGVWNRISGNAQVERNKMLWLRIAAGVALLMCASMLVIQFPDRNESNVATHTKKPVTPPAAKPDTPQQENFETEKRSSSSPSEHLNTTAPGKTQKRDLAGRQKRQSAKPATPASPDLTIQPIPGQVENLTITPLPGSAPHPQEENTSIADVPDIETNKNITIVLTAKEVNDKYLKKKNIATQATSDDIESSGLRKLLDKASDLKYNQDPFGDLRQKKNEILALNFKSGKRNENQ